MDNQVEVENFTETELIGFTTTTTRAVRADLTKMKNDPTGFRVYATGGNAPTDWFSDGTNRIDDTNHHKFYGVKWGFTLPVKWSKSGSDYPMKFYALYPAAPAGFQSFTNTVNPLQIAAFYTVPDVAAQEDLMAAKASVAARPVSSTVGLVFRHILSKINFGIIAGTGTVPMIQSLQVENAQRRRAFDFISGEWFGPTTELASYLYYGKAPAGTVIPVFTPTHRNGTTANPIYNDVHSNHLMLLPQTTPSWKPKTGFKRILLFQTFLYQRND